MYRLSGHSLAIETGRHRQNRLPREAGLCSLCHKREIETESQFLLYCDKYKDLREFFFEKINHIYPGFIHLPDPQKLSYLCGEKSQCALIAAKYVKSCHTLRETSSVVHVSV